MSYIYMGQVPITEDLPYKEVPISHSRGPVHNFAFNIVEGGHQVYVCRIERFENENIINVTFHNATGSRVVLDIYMFVNWDLNPGNNLYEKPLINVGPIKDKIQPFVPTPIIVKSYPYDCKYSYSYKVVSGSKNIYVCSVKYNFNNNINPETKIYFLNVGGEESNLEVYGVDMEVPKIPCRPPRFSVLKKGMYQNVDIDSGGIDGITLQPIYGRSQVLTYSFEVQGDKFQNVYVTMQEYINRNLNISFFNASGNPVSIDVWGWESPASDC